MTTYRRPSLGFKGVLLLIGALLLKASPLIWTGFPFFGLQSLSTGVDTYARLQIGMFYLCEYGSIVFAILGTGFILLAAAYSQWPRKED